VTTEPPPPRTARIIVLAVVGTLVLVAAAVTAAVLVPRHLEVAAEPATCWNGILTDPCLPLEGMSGAMWAFDPNQVVSSSCDRLHDEDYFELAEEAWYCSWPDLRADVYIARFPLAADGPALWRDVADANGFREMDADTWPTGEALGPGFFGSTPMTKDLDAPFLALCYDDLPYCVEIDARSNRGLEAAEDRIATLPGREVDAYLAEPTAAPTGDV
jgi:hypothetical protein